MCRLPLIRAPARGLLAPCCLRSAINPGISCSASLISLRPKSACERSLTVRLAARHLCRSERMHFSVAVVIASPLFDRGGLKGRPTC
jgi:hypothetical protein